MIPKFRAWDKVFKEMVQVNALVLDKQVVKVTYKNGNVAKEDMKEYELMQSTGLKDKNNQEIFEGDILHHQIQTDYTFIVKYDKDNGRWYGDGLSRTYRIDIAKRFLPYYYKVIGNIYENPELLEVE